MAASHKSVYSFGEGKADGAAKDKNLLGGKGANLAEMTRIGLPVPPGFTISTEVCSDFYRLGRRFPKTLDADVRRAVARVERVMGAPLRRRAEPAARLGALGRARSMPGMMDTVLNLGLNDDTVQGLAETTRNERFA